MSVLVCPFCRSARLMMAGKHGYVECQDCGEFGHGVPMEDYEPSESQQNLIPIPEGYNEQ